MSIEYSPSTWLRTGRQETEGKSKYKAITKTRKCEDTKEEECAF
jgi:hypothetical protein